MDTAITAVIVAVLTAIFTFAVQYYLSESTRVRALRTERLTKLLLPLYMKINEEDMDMQANIVHDDGDPAGFLSDLPEYYETTYPILSENLYLADEELTEKALKFIAWTKIDKYDSGRFDQVMTRGTNDTPLYEFKKCVEEKYKEEKAYMFSKKPFWSDIYP